MAYQIILSHAQQTVKVPVKRVHSRHRQSHYIEVVQGAIFMEQKMRFGLILGRLAILKKKIGADYEQLLRAVFLCFHEIFFLKYCSVCTKKLHKKE